MCHRMNSGLIADIMNPVNIPTTPSGFELHQTLQEHTFTERPTQKQSVHRQLFQDSNTDEEEQTSSEETNRNKTGHRQKKKGCLISRLHSQEVKDRRLQTGTKEQWTKRTLTTAPQMPQTKKQGKPVRAFVIWEGLASARYDPPSSLLATKEIACPNM
ncbi:uncharacterized protein [Miscanthus floridulus]|uniref:uncharacterized protein n=1 Tax=Miscanthus floridulus TaxID=154761 RepID=UPI003458980E